MEPSNEMNSSASQNNDGGVNDPNAKPSLSPQNIITTSTGVISRFELDRLENWIRMSTLKKRLHEIEELVKAERGRKRSGRNKRDTSLEEDDSQMDSSNFSNDLQNEETRPKYEHFNRVQAQKKADGTSNPGKANKRMHTDASSSTDAPLKKSKSASRLNKDTKEDWKSDSMTLNDAQTKGDPSTYDLHMAAKPRVSVRHAKYPKVMLQEDEMKKIQNEVLEEMDKIEDSKQHPQFLASIKREGWMSIICNDEESMNWILQVLAKMTPKLIVHEGDIVPKSHVCIAYIPTEDAMSKETFLLRIRRQNPGISTRSWRVARMNKGKRGGLIVIFYVDDASKAYLEGNNFKLFLNLSQIRVNIRRRSGSSSELDDETDSIHNAKSSCQDVPDPGAPSCSGVTTAESLSAMQIDGEDSMKSAEKRRRKKNSKPAEATGNPTAASDSD